MKSLLPLAAAAALFTGFTVFAGFSAPATAGEMTSRGTVGPWEMTGGDKSCMARKADKNGTHLSFAINAHGEAMIAIENPNWKIPKGKYEVVTQVDRTEAQRVGAEAEDFFLIFGFHLNEPTLNLLSYGRTLSVTVGTQTYQYELTRTEAMLKALGQCAAPFMAAANPFAGSPPAARTPASTETPSNPFRRL